MFPFETVDYCTTILLILKLHALKHLLLVEEQQCNVSGDTNEAIITSTFPTSTLLASLSFLDKRSTDNIDSLMCCVTVVNLGS